MAWLRIEDGFAEHPKVENLTDRAFRLHVLGLCACSRKLTDGRISARTLRMLLALSTANRRHVAELVQAGLWIEDSEGHFVRDFLEYNPSAEEVKERRRSAAERTKQWRNRKSDASQNALRDASPSRPVPKNIELRSFKPVEKPLSCPECGVGFLTKQRLGEHLSDCHHIDVPTEAA